MDVVAAKIGLLWFRTESKVGLLPNNTFSSLHRERLGPCFCETRFTLIKSYSIWCPLDVFIHWLIYLLTQLIRMPN